MDRGTDHYLTEETSHAVVRQKFMKGVAVLEIPGESPQYPPLQIGELFIPEKAGPACHICKKAGHLRADCPDRQAAQKCRLCKQTGHVKNDCPDFVCSNCGDHGHMSKKCKASKKKTCLNCEKTGHVSADCLEPCFNCGGTNHVVNNCYKGN